jgi:nicotinamidase/pyrazinamidase
MIISNVTKRTVNFVDGQNMKHALIIADMINDFVTGTLKVKRAQAIIPNIRELLKLARKNKLVTIHVTDSHLPKIDPEFDLWGPHAARGSWGSQIIDEFKPKGDEYRVLKRKYSAFQGTELDMLLRELKIEAVILTGVLTDICIQHTAADAFSKSYKVIIPKDCVETLDEPTQEYALNFMRKNYGAEITTVNELAKKKWM